jgi:type I restriction enzyme S subunit
VTGLKPYPEYKDSWVVWLGEVPANWRIVKFRYAFRESTEVNGDTPVGPMLSVSGYRGVEEKIYDDDNQRRSDEEVENYRVVRPGQLAVNTMWLNYAGLGVSALTGHVSPAYRAYWIDGAFDERYVHHLMRSSSYVDAYTSQLTGIRPNSLQLSRDNLMAFPILQPPRDEQRVIARFLDRETAAIDAFIADQEELIRLLTERRAATISHAVTNGLDMAAEMCQTGSAWFPSLPAHWELMPVRLGASLIQTGPFGSQLHADDYVSGGIPLVNPMHMDDGEIKTVESTAVTEEKAAELRRHALRPGDVVIARRGELGRSAVVKEKSAGALCGTGSAIVRLRNDSFDPRYFQLVFNSRQNRDALLQHSVGSTMDNLNTEVVGSLRVPAPPLDDQRAIVAHVERKGAEFDAALADAREAIALSRERRAALISAAVTGKIDVRGHGAFQNRDNRSKSDTFESAS